MGIKEHTLSDETFCHEVAKALKPIISIRAEEIPAMLRQLNPIQQAKHQVALDIHKTIVQFTENNRYFEGNKIQGKHNWLALADELHDKITEYQAVLTKAEGKKYGSSLFAPAAGGADRRLEPMAKKLIHLMNSHIPTIDIRPQ